MWRFKPFTHKESAGLEGRTIDVGNLKVHVRNAIAEGGFSCVYIARDIASSKQYALKHMICNDEESLDLVTKEIAVMKLLKGQPNVVTLVAHTIIDMGRTKEAFLIMEFCDKPLVGMLENRGAGYLDEKKIFMIFRDICNAVFAMHNQSPPIAHRDLKAENILLGADGAWKLCDFGSTSTNHKCFDKPEEMGIEEDNIRKYTTPAYRAPEMWDLFRKEIISEKVDIWALGCLLYRICYLKLAFDGESKLQILNGNYRIPELPKYSPSITGLIKDMLQASPVSRPDITQVWFRVNEQLPMEQQKHLPDCTTSAINSRQSTSEHGKGILKKTPSMPRRSPPPPPLSRGQSRNASSQPEKDLPHPMGNQATSKPVPVAGSFWSTQHAQDAVLQNSGALLDEESISQVKSKTNQNNIDRRPYIQEEQRAHSGQFQGNMCVNPIGESTTGDVKIRFSPDDAHKKSDKTKSYTESKTIFQNEAFNSLIADFDTSKLISMGTADSVSTNKAGWEGLEIEVERVKEQLSQANLEKAEITSKYEKLSAICRSQHQEIQELKQLLSARTPLPPVKDTSKSQLPPVKDTSKSQFSSGNAQLSSPLQEKTEGTVWELQQGMLGNNSSSPNPELKPWQAFTEESKAQPSPINNYPKSVRTNNGSNPSSANNGSNPSSAGASSNNSWGFENNSIAFRTSSHISRTNAQGNTSQCFVTSEVKKVEPSHPSSWAGF